MPLGFDLTSRAVLIGAAIVNMIIGMVWYSTPVFGRPWIEAIGKRPEELGAAGPGYLISFIASLVVAGVLALFIDLTGAATSTEGAVLGFYAWLGFVVTTAAPGVVFERRSPRVYQINMGYNLVSFLAMGALIAAVL